MKTIVLISCVSKKLAHRAPAADLYISPLFRMNLAYAWKLQPDAIYILSTKYGLLEPDEVVEPYDVTLNSMRAVEVKAWAKTVLEQLQAKTDLKQDKFVFLAGEKYRKYLLPRLAHYAIPLKGMRIGEQLQYLKRSLES